MRELELTAEQYQAYSIIELSIHLQRSIEILDNLASIDHPMKNKQLRSQLKGVYQPLDKQTKLYNDLYNISDDGMNHFYDAIKENSRFIMSKNILDQTLICSFLNAHEKDSKSVEGIINKVLKK